MHYLHKILVYIPYVKESCGEASNKSELMNNIRMYGNTKQKNITAWLSIGERRVQLGVGRANTRRTYYWRRTTSKNLRTN